jgi:2'-5' RNA ligase
MRTFVAVELPERVRIAVSAAAAPLLAGKDVRPVSVENLHITIRFLGEVDPARLPAVRSALADAASAVPAAEAKVFAFAKLRWDLAPRVWVAYVDEEPSGVLRALEREVTPRIAPLGIPPDRKRFYPHVTIGRARRRDRRSPWLDEENRCGPSASPKHDPIDLPFPVRELTLFDSELTPRGSRYTALARFPLATV